MQDYRRQDANTCVARSRYAARGFSFPLFLNNVRRRWRGATAPPLLVLLLLLAAVTWRDLALLLSRPVAAGLDGYYYVLQVDELLHHGRFYFPNNTPISFLFLAGIRLLTGDTVLAIKIGGVTLHALLCLGLFALITRTTHSAWLGLTAGALASASQLHLFMVAEFIKNLCALTLLVWCGWCVIRALQTRGAFRLWCAALLAVTAAVLSHRSTIFVAAILGASVLLVRGMTSPNSPGRYRGLALAATLALWCAPLLAARQALITLPPWLTNELAGGARWPISEIASIEKMVLLVACLATLFIITIFRKRLTNDPAMTFFGSVALLGLLLTLNPFLRYDLGWVGISARLTCLAYVQLAVLVPALVWLLRLVNRETTVYTATVAASLLVVLNAYAPLPLGVRPGFLTEREQLIQALGERRQRFDPHSFVIAPHGDQFVVTSTLNIPAQQRWPQEGVGGVVYWLLRYVEDQSLEASMTVLTTEPGGLHTVMISDDDLKILLASMPVAERMRLLVHNSHLQKKYAAASLGRGPDTEEF